MEDGAPEVPPEEEAPADDEVPDVPTAALAFVLQPADGELPEGGSYAFSWELSFAPDRQELLLEETDENGEARLTLVVELPAEARAWEIGEPGTYRVRAWLGEESALSEAFTVTAAPDDPVGDDEAAPAEETEDPRDDLDPAEEAAPLPPDGETEGTVASGSCGTNLRWTLDDAGTLTISGTGAMKDYSFSGSYSAPWRSRSGSIKRVVIQSGVTSIGEYAFYDCSNFTTVSIPGSVTSIGQSAFYGCFGLTSVTIPQGVTRIYSWAFYCCDGMTSVSIPNSVTYIGEGAFSTCLGLTSVTIPSGVTTIGNEAFSSCSNLSEIRFLGGPPSIRSDAFSYVTAKAYYPSGKGWKTSNLQNYGGRLTWVEMFSGTCGPNLNWFLVEGTLTITGSGPMEDYSYGDTPWFTQESSIKTLKIEPGITTIGNRAFEDCSGLTSVTIPEGVTSIGDRAFHSCENLWSVTLPEGIVSIGDRAFEYCGSLTRFKLPSTVQSLGTYCFASCSSLGTMELHEGLTVIPEYAFNQCGIRTIRIPASVTTVEVGAFHYCTLDVVFFGGTRAQWDALSIDYSNTPLRIARIICEGDMANGEGSESLTMRMTEGESYPYTGKAVKPAVEVYHGTTLLTEGKDYSVSYKNNTKAYVLTEGDEGFAAKKAPTVTVTGKGNFSGSASTSFVILPKDLADEDISAPDLFKAYNKKAQMLVPAVKYGKTALKNKTDFAVQYPDGAVSGSYTEIGSWTILLTGNGNYTGSRTVTLHIGKALASSFSLSKIAAQTYTGEAICPALTVKSGKTVLTEGTDYALLYENNVEIGTATVTVTGLGDYVGSKTASFKINGYALSKAKIALGAASKTYDGTEQTNTYTLTFTRPDKSVVTLAEGEDFTVAYEKNVNVGTAQIIFTGIGHFSGTVKKSFKIVQRPMSEGIEVTPIGSVPYEKGGVKPRPVVRFGGAVLTEGKDYTLSYKNNSKVYSYPEGDPMFEAKYAPTVTISGKGNFKGSVQTYYILTKATLGRVSVTAPDKTYANKPNIYKSTPTLYDLNGKKLSAGVDYEKNFLYNYWRSTDVMYFGTPIRRSGGDYVSPYDVIPAGTRIEVEIIGKGMYEGKAFASYYITAASIGSAKVTIPAQTYTGAPIRPSGEDVVVRVGGQRIEEGKDYVIVGYENNVNKGTAKLSIRGNGNYGGVKTVTFKINARPMNVWQAAANAISKFLWSIPR